jgi:nucleoid DNA-binding protein
METLTNSYNLKINTNPNKLHERRTILAAFSNEAIERTWESFCKFIAQNYEIGKGTIIHKFGAFTFTNTEVNLEGTTNQFNRDQKARKPVFIVSSDFVERLKAGIFNTGGIIYYTQKINNNISHVKLNYAHIAMSTGLKKEDCSTIIEYILKSICDSIVSVIIKILIS